MPTVAEQLHLAREAQKLSVNQVAEITKIRTDHIRALEEGNFNVFSAPVYIRGFVRSYAGLLKLDVPNVMTALEHELGGTEKFREPPPLSQHKRGILDFLTLQLSKLNWRVAVGGLIVLGAVALIFGIVMIIRHYQTYDPLAKLQPGVYESKTVGGEIAPLPTTNVQRR